MSEARPFSPSAMPMRKPEHPVVPPKIPERIQPEQALTQSVPEANGVTLNGKALTKAINRAIGGGRRRRKPAKGKTGYTSHHLIDLSAPMEETL